ncbi:3-keto-disaccharide hydrolase [Sphingomonas sp. 22R3R2A-7]|uniref:3-keto-disaccharide hydrolase n=1 Tax=Sphingomonas sp. 22R3R2A-7 TaxID=3050230 RepID=UPI002FE2DB32
MLMWFDRTLVALLVLSAPATAQTSKDAARAIAGEPAKSAQRLTLTDIPVPTGKPTALFDGRSLKGWTPWLGYADPSITYRSDPGAPPIGTSRDTSGDFAVRSVDGAPAIWVKGETWGSLVNAADLGDYHLRLQFKWGAKTWAPRVTLPRNNGLLYHTHGTAGDVFGTWRPSVEFEIMTGSTGMIVAVGGKVRGRTSVTFDPSLAEPHLRYRAGGREIDIVNGTPTWNVEAATDAERPVGAWNTLDLYVVGDRAVHVVNGVPVAEVHDLATIASDGSRRPLTHGQIQLQSEGAETWFRAITVEPITSLPKIVVAAP